MVQRVHEITRKQWIVTANKAQFIKLCGPQNLRWFRCRFCKTTAPAETMRTGNQIGNAYKTTQVSNPMRTRLVVVTRETTQVLVNGSGQFIRPSHEKGRWTDPFLVRAARHMDKAIIDST